MKTISVLMATYNGQKYIREQIESVIFQEEVNINLLVRDDGSSDATCSILQEYKEKGKLDWYSGAHLNVARGFLELIEKAPKSDYYAFCDQDDVWIKDKLIAAIRLLENQKQNIPLLYYSSTTLVDDNLKFICDHKIRTKRNDLARFVFNDMSGNTMVFNNALRDLICQNTNIDISIHDKWILQLCLATGGKCIGDPNSHILYRQHSNNTIGMELNLKDKIKKFLRVINSPKDMHFVYLYKYYSQNLVFPYLDIIKKCNNQSKMKFVNRIRIIMNKEIIFSDLFYQIAFYIHVLKGNL